MIVIMYNIAVLPPSKLLLSAPLTSYECLSCAGARSVYSELHVANTVIEQKMEMSTCPSIEMVSLFNVVGILAWSETDFHNWIWLDHY